MEVRHVYLSYITRWKKIICQTLAGFSNCKWGRDFVCCDGLIGKSLFWLWEVKWFDWTVKVGGYGERDFVWWCFNDWVPLRFDCKNCRGIGGWEGFWRLIDNDDLPEMICDCGRGGIKWSGICWLWDIWLESKRYGW